MATLLSSISSTIEDIVLKSDNMNLEANVKNLVIEFN